MSRWKASIALSSNTTPMLLRSRVHRAMKAQSDSPLCYLQAFSSTSVPGLEYVPRKFLTNASLNSSHVLKEFLGIDCSHPRADPVNINCRYYIVVFWLPPWQLHAIR